jgi:hypothetical protein
VPSARKHFNDSTEIVAVSPRSVLSVLALVVAVSLIGAPLTMHDWGEKAHIGAEPIENTSNLPEETPVLQYESLSPNAQQAVRVAIQRGGVTIYGTEDWPDEFAYGDVLEPGSGRYVVVYEGQPYRVTTVGGLGVGNDPVERTAFQLPFVGYGLFLLYVTRQTDSDDRSLRTPGAFVAVGASFHLLGPEFDFWMLSPIGYSALGFIGFLVIGWWATRDAL